jgi:AAA+ ATPase superfamily predicted ATPase
LERVKKKQENLFKVFIRKIKEIADGGARPILILDEIQKLRDVYIANGNSERELLKEFLNFCIRLTKETHLCHVVILTSNTVFVERIYNDAKMKLTSDFKKIGHLEKWKVDEWLGIEGLKDKEIELVWEYLGGCPPLILKMLGYYKRDVSLKKYLEEQKWLAYTEIDEYLAEFGDEEVEYFKEVAQKIVKNGYYSIEGVKKSKREFLQKWAEKEILFYDPLELKVTGNSRIYEKGLELLLERHIHT